MGQPLGGAVFVGCQRDFANVRPPLDFDETHIYGSLRVFGMRAARNQIEAPVVAFHTFHYPALSFLMGNDGLNSNALNFWIANHRCNSRRTTLRVWQHPSPTNVLNVTH